MDFLQVWIDSPRQPQTVTGAGDSLVTVQSAPSPVVEAGPPWPVIPGTWVRPPLSNYGFTEKPWWWDAPLPFSVEGRA